MLPPETTLLEDDCCELFLDLLLDGFIKSNPLVNPEFILHTDGSSIVEEGMRKLGWAWAVTTMDNVIMTGTLDLRKADVHFMSDTMLNYCIQLSNAVGEADIPMDTCHSLQGCPF